MIFSHQEAMKKLVEGGLQPPPKQPVEPGRMEPIDDDAEGAIMCNICCFSYKDEGMFTLKTC